MENRVGSNVPAPAALQSLLEQLQTVLVELQKFGIVLSTAERKRLLRARRDSGPSQRLVFELARKKTLSLEGFPLEEMRKDLDLAQAMEPFESALGIAQQLARDTLLQAQTEAWQAFLGYYGVLAAMATRDAELATALKPAIAFMKNGRRKPEPEPESASQTEALA